MDLCPGDFVRVPARVVSVGDGQVNLTVNDNEGTKHLLVLPVEHVEFLARPRSDSPEKGVL